MRLEKYLDDTPDGEGQKTPVLIEGPPGCGKSTTAWQWAMESSQESPDISVRWITAAGILITLEHGTIRYEALPTVIPLTAILFIDGVTQDTAIKWEPVINKAHRAGTQVIIVSSMPLPILKHHVQRKRFTMAAWTQDEYKAACRHDPFFDQVLPNILANTEQRQETYTAEERDFLVERKYAVAGCSARWEFDMPYQEVIITIDAQLERISDPSQLFARTVREGGAAVGNTLVLSDSVQTGLKIFTSSYVARVLSLHLNGADIARLNELVALYGNQAMRGYAVEIDFIVTVCRKGVRGRVKYVAEPPDPASASSRRKLPGPRALEPEFDNSFTSDPHPHAVTFYRDTLPRNSLGINIPGTWYLPLVPNQGGFDVVQLREVGVANRLRAMLRFVILTVQTDHDIKFDFMRVFLEDFNTQRARLGLSEIVDVEVILMLPTDMALLHKPPTEWVIRGIPRFTRSSRTTEQIALNVTYRVASFTITSSS